MNRYRLIETTEYAKWFFSIKDRSTKRYIDLHIRRLTQGNFRNVKPVGDGVFELRMYFGPGYRVYFVVEGGSLVILVFGGDKSGQKRDIERAKTIWHEFEMI
jgi:putative addiction module killer protein